MKSGPDVSAREPSALWAALAAFLASELLYAAIALASGFDPLSPATWSRWDSGHYLQIATSGYTMERCLTGRAAGDWCGSVGWFPGFPILIGMLRKAGIRPELGAFLLVESTRFGALYVLCHLTKKNNFFFRGAAAVGLACVFPGSIYLHALFPLAPLVFCTLLAFQAVSAERPTLAAAFSLIAATLYPTGFLVGLSIAAAAPNRRGIQSGVAAVLGLALVALIQHHDTGAWDAYIKVHHQYEQGIHNPLETLGVQLKRLVNPKYRSVPSVWAGLQTVLILALLGWMLSRSRELWSETTTTRTLLLYTCAAWLFPLVVGGQTPLYRTEVLLAPAALLLHRLPLKASLPALAAALTVFIAMERLFLNSILI